MQVTSQLTEQDFGLYARAVRKNYKGRTYTHVGAVIAMAVIAGLLAAALKRLLFAYIGNHGQAWDLGVYFVLFLFIYLSLIRTLARLFTRGQFSPDGHFLAATQFTLAPEGFTTQSRYTQGKVDWRGVLRLEESKDFLLIYIDLMQAYVIPKRCFATTEAAAAFYQQAQAYWQAARQADQVAPPASGA